MSSRRGADGCGGLNRNEAWDRAVELASAGTSSAPLHQNHLKAYMPAVTQLSPPIPLLTPRGPGLAHLVIDYGPEHDLMWTVFLDDSGECWTFANPHVRAQKNMTLGRTAVAPPAAPAGSPGRGASGVANGHGEHRRD